MKRLIFYVLLGSVITVMGCSSDSDSGSSAPATQVADAIGLVAKGVGAIGSGMTGTALMGSITPMTVTQFNTNRCDSHGRPLASAGGSDLSQSDEFYPYLHTYCAVSIKDGDTVRGGFNWYEASFVPLKRVELSSAAQHKRSLEILTIPTVGLMAVLAEKQERLLFRQWGALQRALTHIIQRELYFLSLPSA